MAGEDVSTATNDRQPKPPSLLDAVLPVVVLIVLIAITIWLFGVSATDGPLQVALLLSAAFASLIAFKNGYTAAAIPDAAVGDLPYCFFNLLSPILDVAYGFLGFTVPKADELPPGASATDAPAQAEAY